MWIQIRTIDGKETRTVEDLSRLTKIESLRAKIRDIFDVKPEQQRLFYRGKQVRSGSCSHGDSVLAQQCRTDSKLIRIQPENFLPQSLRAIHWSTSITCARASVCESVC